MSAILQRGAAAVALAAACCWTPVAACAGDPAIERRVADLLAKMTLEEKVGQLHQVVGFELTGPGSEEAAKRNKEDDIRSGKVGSMLTVRGAAETRRYQQMALQSRLKIPLLFAFDVIHGYKTVFPVPLGEAASWDLDAIHLSARIAAKESAAAGVHWTFAPMVDIGRDPRWGRVMEGAGEDTYLGEQIARARVQGFQGSQPGALDAVMATAKHFAGYGAALAGRDYAPVDMSEQQLHEVYLPPFKAAADAGVDSFMNSFNSLNGVPSTGNPLLGRGLLKGAWGYQGIVISDWQSVAEMVPHGYVRDLADAAVKALKAGNDIDMEGYAYLNHLAPAVEQGKVDMASVDAAVSRVLYRKFALGLFDDPFRFSDPARERAVLSDPSHRVAARDVARKSMVLLKNDGARPVLPLAAGLKSIAVVGPLAEARRDLEGAWVVESTPQQVVPVAEAIRRRAGSGTRVSVAAGCQLPCTSSAGFAAAVRNAAKADVIVAVLGESWDQTGEARSRADLTLPGKQEALFAALKRTGKPVVAVLLSGRPLVFNQLAAQADAILYAWLPGSEGGNAVADVLFGDYNPSGKLPMTFPRSVGQIPITYAAYNTGRPVVAGNSDYRSAYIDLPVTPQYAFGHGLSYTQFAYRNLRLSDKTLRQDGKLTLSFDLANTGKRAGAEVVQLYVRDMVSSIVRPIKELKGFRKLTLQPGEQQTVSFSIDRDMLSFVGADLQRRAEPGEFRLMVGSASDDIRLEAAIELLGDKE